MHKISFDLDVLRSFVTGVELGSFAQAAERVGRSTSAISAQLKKLEEQVGVPVLRKAGRGMALTPTGEILLGYARRLLALNDEAAAAVRGADLAGVVRIGLQEDFAEHLLPSILGSFTRAHPQVQIEARVTRNAQLLELIRSNQIDIALSWDAGAASAYCEQLGVLPMCWIGPAEHATAALANTQPLPLVLFESPCLMRSAATQALDQAGQVWRVAFSGGSLNALWAAVSAGLGITVRTRAGLPAHLRVLQDMPALPSIALLMHRAEAVPTPAVRALGEIIAEHLRELPGRA
ncbi:LysR substrate-binding domain-containing protein [Uliginosibacterium sediminicola]|uniref:LysR substrate-binding domain-containing protein n=1 Tax=Uliginosibacterium sediminicola TaxID=2024550 RepID=A0ABU9YTM7_9RHOO